MTRKIIIKENYCYSNYCFISMEIMLRFSMAKVISKIHRALVF